jgi:predicted RNase H-like HicB family nuclease
MKTAPKLKVILEKSNTGYSAYEKEIAGIYTTGKNIQEVKENIQEVIEVQVEYLEEQGKIEDAQKLKDAEIEFYLDVKQFFQEYKFINKSAFAEAIGEKPGYIRKITSGLVKLSDDKSLKIQEGLHKLGKELLSVNFI